MNTSATAPLSPGEPNAAKPERTRAYSPFAAIVLGGFLAIVSVIVYFLVFAGERLPLVTRETYAAATRRWDALDVKNYDVTVRVEARTTDVYHTEVRGGKVERATRNGISLDQPRTLGTWSVPGMFDTLETDLASQEGHVVDAAFKKKVDLTLRGRFNGQYGFPERYQRIEWGAVGEIDWEVTEFRVVEP